MKLKHLPLKTRRELARLHCAVLVNEIANVVEKKVHPAPSWIAFDVAERAGMQVIDHLYGNIEVESIDPVNFREYQKKQFELREARRELEEASGMLTDAIFEFFKRNAAPAQSPGYDDSREVC